MWEYKNQLIIPINLGKVYIGTKLKFHFPKFIYDAFWKKFIYVT